MATLRLIFLGTPEFAVPSLRALVEAGHEVALVVTRPDQPQGRGRHVGACAVKLAAQQLGLPVAQPAQVNDPTFIAELRQLRTELGVVVAFGRILSTDFLTIPLHGFVNVHASLLPRWRGAAPIQRGLLAGDTEFGVTVQCVAEKMDAGEVIVAEAITAEAADNLGTLEARLAPLGAHLLTGCVQQFATGRVARIPQDESAVTFAPTIKPGEERIDWRQSARAIVNRVRAFNPRPLAYAHVLGERLNIYGAVVCDMETASAPGTVIAIGREGPVLATGDGAVRLLEVQYASRRRMSAFDWANGTRLRAGQTLGSGLE